MDLTKVGIPISSLIITFIVLIVLGLALTLPLYKFNWKKLVATDLFIKIMFWIPIFTVFVLLLYMNLTAQLLVLGGVVLACAIEAIKNGGNSPHKPLVFLYLILIGVGLSYLGIMGSAYSQDFISLLITLAFGVVLADVTAFFFGNYLGKHKLPAFLNPRKSWEGAFGEVVGAALGVLIVNTFIMPVVSIWIFIPIGLGSAIGDLANSFVKRQVGIKEWSNFIPGHGGFMDRFCSLAGSSFLTYYFLKILNIV